MGGVRIERWISWGGFALGAAIAFVTLTGWHVAGGDGRLGADVTFSTGPIGELDLPSGIFVQAPDLRPGRSAEGSVPVRNRTGTTLAVSLRALPSGPDLDSLLVVDVRAGGRTLYTGPLAGLRTWTRGSLRLASGASEDLVVTAELPASAANGYQARIEDVPLELRARPVGS